MGSMPEMFLLMLPEIIILLTGLAVLLLAPFVEPERKRLTPYLALFGTALAFVANLGLHGATSKALFNNMFVIDDYAWFFHNIFLAVNFLVILLSLQYLEDEYANMGEYYAMLMYATVGMMLMAACNDLLGIYIALELTSITLYILAGYFRRYAESNEAAIKYYLTGILASSFLLYGMSLLYGVTGTTELKGLAHFIGASNLLVKNPALGVGMVLVMMGFGFKIAAVPFHMWVPDVYEGAPTCVTAFMSTGPKAAGFATILRVFYVGLNPLKPDWAILFGIIAILTMTTGNILALMQKSVKRMLAYSSIAHAGYAILGLAVAGTSMEQAGISGVMFYMFSYVFMNIGAFAMLILLRKQALTSETLEEFNGLAQRAPVLAAVLSVFLFSLTGIPPTLGFVGKFYLFGAVMKVALEGKVFYSVLAVVAVLNAAISAFYYLRLMMNMYFKDGVSTLIWKYSHSLMLVIVLSILAVLFFGIYPGQILSLAQESVKILL